MYFIDQSFNTKCSCSSIASVYANLRAVAMPEMIAERSTVSEYHEAKPESKVSPKDSERIRPFRARHRLLA